MKNKLIKLAQSYLAKGEIDKAQTLLAMAAEDEDMEDDECDKAKKKEGDDTDVDDEKPKKKKEKASDNEDGDNDGMEDDDDDEKSKSKKKEDTDDYDDDECAKAETARIKLIEEKMKTFQYPKQFSSLKELQETTKCNFIWKDDQATTFILQRDGADVLHAKNESCPSHIKDDVFPLTKSAFGKKAGSNPDFSPTNEEYERIMDMVPGKKWKKEDFKVFYITAADTVLDRHFTHFARKALKKMSDTAYETSGLKNHDYYNESGVWCQVFDSKVTKGANGEQYLMLKDAVLNTPKNKDTIDGLMSFNNKISVGVSIDRDHMICDICNVPVFSSDFKWCGHYPGWTAKETGKPATATFIDANELLEHSIVTVPAQRMAAARDHKDLAEKLLAKTMTLSKSFDTLSAANESKLAELQKSIEDLATIKTDMSGGEINVEELIKLLKQHFEASKASNDELLQGMKTCVSELKETVSEMKTATAAKEEAFEKHVKEQSERLEVLSSAVQEVSKSTGILIGQSVAQIERTRAMTKSTSRTGSDAYAAKQAESDQYYSNFADRTYSDDEMKKYQVQES